MSKTQTNTGEFIPGVRYGKPPNLHSTMDGYDRLPRVVRDAVGKSPYRFSIERAWQELRWGRTPAEVAELIASMGREAIALAYADRAKR